MFGFGLKKKFERFRVVDLPGEVGTVSLPECFETQLERDDTLLAYLKDDDAINLRFLSMGIVPKGDSETVGYTQVIEEAQKKKCKLKLYKGKSSFQEESISGEEKYIDWRIGTGNSIVLISACIRQSKCNSKPVQYTLEAMPRIIESIEITLRHEVIHAEGLKVHNTSKMVDAWPQMTAPFGPYEERWLEDNLNRARQLGFKYGSGGELTPEELDSIFTNWMHETEQKEEPDVIANALGAALGRHISDQLGFNWIVVNDENGQEYSLYHEGRRTYVYPRCSVAKRIACGETGDFIAGLYLAIKTYLARRSAE